MSERTNQLGEVGVRARVLQPMDPCQDPAGDAGDRRQVPKVRPGSTSWGVGWFGGSSLVPLGSSTAQSTLVGVLHALASLDRMARGLLELESLGMLRPAKSSSFGFGAYWVATVVLLCRTD